MKYYIIAPSASGDLNNIADYFLTVNVSAGEKLFQEFNQKCKNLANFPKMGKSYNHIKPNLRGLTLNSYIIFYRIIDDTIEILRVVNGRQDLEFIFSEDN
jgi:toxin ParE1/3/4